MASCVRRFFLVFAAMLALLSTACSTNVAAATSVSKANVDAGITLEVGERLTSASRVYSAVLQSSGQVVIEKNHQQVWESSSNSGLRSIAVRESSGALRAHRLIDAASTHRTTKGLTPVSWELQNNGDLALVNRAGVPVWQGGVHANTSPVTTTSYTPGELYGDSNPSALCYTCQAASFTQGVAPPSNTLDSGTSVDNMTGDFSTVNTLFSAPAVGSNLSLSLSYDSLLAQSQLTTSGSAMNGVFGDGWTSNFSAAINVSGSTTTIDQGNGSQVTFNESAGGGSLTTCPAGDYPYTSKYSINGSGTQYCALASVQGQVGTVNGNFAYEQSGGQDIEEFGWNGELEEDTTLAASSGSSPTGVFELYNVAGGTTMTPTGVTLDQPCPTSATCIIIYANDGRDIVEELDSNGQVSEIVDPSGATYAITYQSPAGNTIYPIASITKSNGTSTPSIWTYYYSNVANPYAFDMVQIFDPIATQNYYNVGGVPPGPGTSHTTSISYYSTAPKSTAQFAGMVQSVEDGTGATTSYAYSQGCATGACVGGSDSQTTTVTYPAQTPCASGTTGCTPTAQSPVEIDQYSGGLETSESLGSLTNLAENETWSYSWNLGNGTANSSEMITYPDSLKVASQSQAQPPSATIITDPSGNVVSTTNALGDVATSTYNDVGGNNLPELLWSFPGAVASGTTSPPVGASSYTYNSVGQTITATDPDGNVTAYGYYAANGELCYEAPPRVVALDIGSWTSAGVVTPPSCTGSTSSGAVGAPVGATTFSYDVQGDVIAATVDAGDSGPNADTQTTTASYDLMGDELWSIPPTGQTSGLPQSSSNPFATSTTYAPANLPLSVTAPDGNVTTYTYDLAENVVSTTTPDATVTTVYDGDNRPCYSVTAASAVSGLTCASSMMPGATRTTYVPGSLTTATVTDANGNTTSYYYGDLAYPSDPTQVVDPLGSEQTFTAYDDFGNACLSGSVQPSWGGSQCTDVLGDTATTYNALGSAMAVTDPNGNVTSNYYEDVAYPSALTRTVNALGATTTNAYDPDGNLLATVLPDRKSGVSLSYNANGLVCSKSPAVFDGSNVVTYPCGEGPAVAGVTQYSYNDANEIATMSDNSGNPATPSQWSQNTTYTYSTGQLTSVTDGNNKTVSYLYNDAAQVVCEAYPVSASASCGTLSAPAKASTTNTIVTRTYDPAGRLTSTTDWLGNTITYVYADTSAPTAVTKVSYPSSTGLSATYNYDSDGNVLSLIAGSSISDTWTYNADEQVQTMSLNGVTSAPVTYNANRQITAAANLATSTSDDQYSVAANGEILSDQATSGTTTHFSYNSGDELCNVSTTTVSCGSTPTSGTTYTYNVDGERASSTVDSAGTGVATTNFSWNNYGELCGIGPSSIPCGSTPASGTSYSYNGNGLRMSATTSQTTTDSTWDTVSDGSIPLNINDAAVSVSSPSTTTNTSFIYGYTLFGGTAPVEQISGSTATFLVVNPTGVQGVYGSTGTTQELAIYSPYGAQTVTSGTNVSPFGFQGSYTDATGLIYLINRYYDPTTDSFISVDPDVQQTDQPYAFVDDDPLNATDPLGLHGANYAELNILEYGQRYPGGVRGGSFPKEAEPNRVLYRMNGEKITSYEQYGSDGLPKYRVDLTGASHNGIDTPHLQNLKSWRDPDSGVVIVNKDGSVIKAPDELVPSKSFQSALANDESFAQIYGQISSNEGDGPYPASPFGDSGALGTVDEGGLE